MFPLGVHPVSAPAQRDCKEKAPAVSLYVFATAEDIERVGLKYD